jgi:hypothetical protein
MGVSLHSYLIVCFFGRTPYLPKLHFFKGVIALTAYRPYTIVLFQVGYVLYSLDTIRIHDLRPQIFDLSDFAP